MNYSWVELTSQWITGSIGNYLGAAGNPAPLTLAQWVNVTMTFDESYMDLWINGKLELHSGNSRDLVIPHHKELVLGASLRLLDGGSFFNGRLDDLAIYDRVLSEPEIQQLFIQTVTSKPVQTYFNSFPTNHPEIPIEGPTIEDSEGNIYRIATIGGQIWMVDNLKSTICSDGTELPNVTDDGAWEFSTLEPAYCWYNNDQINMHDVYGALYNFYAVSGECNVCPDGWHIPSIAEWTVLIESLGGLEEAGGKMKTADQRYWAAYDHTATNESGFSAIAAGFRRIGLSQHIGYTASFWSSTPGTKHALDDSGQSVSILSQNGELVINPTQFLTAGLSVRCIQD